jgi:hypothetical protein
MFVISYYQQLRSGLGLIIEPNLCIHHNQFRIGLKIADKYYPVKRIYRVYSAGIGNPGPNRPSTPAKANGVASHSLILKYSFGREKRYLPRFFFWLAAVLFVP